MLAQTTPDVNLNPTGQWIALNKITIPGIVGGLITLVLIIAAVVFFFMLVIGGIRWITSGGDKANTEAARNQITAALVGLVIVFAAWAIINLLGTFLNINILQSLTIPNAFGP